MRHRVNSRATTTAACVLALAAAAVAAVLAAGAPAATDPTALTRGGTSSSSMAAVSSASATADHSQFSSLADRLTDARERLGQAQPAAHLSDQIVNALVVAWKLRVRLDAVRSLE